MATSLIVLKGELARIQLPKAELGALDQSLQNIQAKSVGDIDELAKRVGVTLEGVSGLIPATFNGITVFFKWNVKPPSMEVYAIGTGSSVYVLATFKSSTPASYRLDSKDRSLRAITIPGL